MKTQHIRRHEPEIPLPHKLGRDRGRVYWRHFVLVAQDWLDRDLCHEDALVEVISPSPADAANLVREEIAPRVERPTSIRSPSAKRMHSPTHGGAWFAGRG